MKKIVLIIILAAIIAVNAVGIVLGQKPKDVPAATQDDSSLNYKLVEAPAQDKSQEHPDFIQTEFEFVAPEGENIALKGTISSSAGYNDVYSEINAIDGDTSGASYWEGAPDVYPNELTVTFNESHTVNAIRLALNPDAIWGKRTQSFSVKIKDGAGEESELFPDMVYEFAPTKGNEVIITFDAVEVTAVTVSFTSNSGAVGPQVAEFEIYE